MEFKVSYGNRRATLYAPYRDEILKHWKRGYFYEAQRGQLLDIIAGYDVGVYVDIGAHWGNHATFMGFQATEMHLIEMRADSFEVLKRNSKQWADKCTYYNMALGDYSGSVSYEQEHKGNVGSTKVVEGFGSIHMVTLDSLNLAPSFIKIDAEGYDLAVLKGAVNTIETHRPIVSAEVAGNEPSINAFMAGLGYKGTSTANATKTTIFVP